MQRIVLLFVAIMLFPALLHAQPGRWTQAGGTEPAFGQQGYGLLTPEERALVDRGEISDAAMLSGGLLGTFMGYGIGHAVQGRWSEVGWKFTVGEIASLTFLIGSVAACTEAEFQDRANETNCAIGISLSAIAYVGLRIWEAIDVWTGPGKHNSKVRALRNRAGWSPPRWSIYATPTGKDSAVAGLQWRF